MANATEEIEQLRELLRLADEMSDAADEVVCGVKCARLRGKEGLALAAAMRNHAAPGWCCPRCHLKDRRRAYLETRGRVK
jgi:hypothetical protein